MSKLELLLQQYDNGFDKEDWFPPIRDALKDVSEEQADWRPEGNHVNTIRETVHHLLFYKQRFLRALREEAQETADGLTNDDTFQAAALGNPTWGEAVKRLEDVHEAIREQLVILGDKGLEKPVPKTKAWQYASGIVRHDAHHLGQIILLRKLQGSWPSRRSFE